MLKMIDVLENSLVQNFSLSLTDEQLHQGILNASEKELQFAVADFFRHHDPLETALALDIRPETLQDLQLGINLQATHLHETAKLAALCLALETNTLQQVEVSDCLYDYPM